MAFPPTKPKKKPRKTKAHLPDDETGHITEWDVIGDHLIGIPQKKEEEDEENNEGNFVMGQSGG